MAVLINQTGRVMIPSVMTSVLADPEIAVDADSRAVMLAGVSAVCLGGKFLGGAVTDKLGGWIVLIVVFIAFAGSSAWLIASSSATIFGAMWLLNSLAYTVTWGAACQVIGVAYDEKERPAQLTKIASASRFGATLGSMAFGTLLKSGLHWRKALAPAVPAQGLLALMCFYKWSTASKAAAAAEKGKGGAKAAAKAAADDGGGSAWGHVATLDFWLMFIPKVVLFTYTQFFMNFMAPLLHSSYGYGHGDAATFAGVGQGGSVLGLLVVGNMLYKGLSPAKQTLLVAVELATCVLVPALLAFKEELPFDLSPAVVPLLALWGLAYALPFYLPPGEFALKIGGKTSAALFTNLFDAGGFSMCFFWNGWASKATKGGDFKEVLLSQSLFAVVSLACMPLCMYRMQQKADLAKKAQ